MASHNLKRLFAGRGLKVGHAIFEFETPGIGQIIGQAGADFAFIDMEHSGFGYAELKRLVTSMRAANIPSLVRPPSKSGPHISRALDVGADGLILPMVGSAAEAEQAVADMKYPPMGRRGVALGIAHDGYTTGGAAKKLQAANKRTAFVALIETAEGIENVDEIAAVKQLDVLWVGHFDLSSSLGIPGEFDNPLFKKSVDKVRRAAKKHGKSLAQLVDNAPAGAALHKKGFDIICYAGDVWTYQKALTEGIGDLRAACAPKSDKTASGKRKK
ncbi:MAG: hpch/hpai aldolase [Alphaproteobacteria bacterium]|nr:hpch/hpai aldolase [Alphaproteobacteria bacterium]MBT4017555.1 hpch/hpai aldolase [Alphaproteobacteria bacterium]MBT4966120.1 hpch/hpai aldolase [Alphaproteobacteria bacterium]MBT5159420.1 hpch/hpai aldolase [Alphaproteobacteria bacterium]MBT5917913.1 hpch/hpai aldolase [Alphaproteobacteria bacterium]